MEWVRGILCFFGFHSYYLIRVDEDGSTAFICPHCADYLEMTDEP